MNKACFLDRDGVLIHEGHYLSDPDHVTVTTGAADTINKLNALGYLVIVITNQAGVARGYYPESSIDLVHAKIDEILAKSKASIDQYYYCPHHPEGVIDEYSIKCHCRKPEIGMIEQAVKDFDIDLSSSFVVGDKLSDVQTAFNAGCKAGILVRTGHGASQIENNDTTSVNIADDINDAVKLFLNGDLK